MPAGAQEALDGFTKRLTDVLIQPTINLLFVVALLIFAWGVFQMIVNSRNGTSDGYKNGKNSILWGLAGMVLMLISSGIVQTMCLWLQVSCT